MSGDKDHVLAGIDGELTTAEHARQTGNKGMVRVCARRAAGLAIGYWIRENHKRGWSSDAMNQLRTVEHDQSMPVEIREAAARLTAKVTERFTPPFSADPLLDAKTIIMHFLQ